MPEPDCQAATETPPQSARDLILKGLGVKRVAAWCGVAEDTVYQWLSRGTEDKPIPTSHVAKIVAGARAEGLDAPIGVLWPAMAEASR